MSDLLFSFWLPSFYFSRDSHSGVAELTFSFDSASFFDSASYFGTFFSFDSVSNVHRNNKKKVWFSCFLHLLLLSGILSDFLSQGSFWRSSAPQGHIPCLERQEKGIRFDERV